MALPDPQASAAASALAPPCTAQLLALQADMDHAQVLRQVLLSCQAQIEGNARHIARAVFEPGHVHQLRVGLRRLRSGLRLMASKDDLGLPAESLAQLNDAAARLFRQLGPAREADVLAELWPPQLLAQIAAEFHVDAAQARHLLQGELAPRLPAAAVARLLRSRASQAFLVQLRDLIAQLPAPTVKPNKASKSIPAGAPVLPKLHRRLRRWFLRAQLEAADFSNLDASGRHALRKRLKRLRYGMEFCLAGHATARSQQGLPLLRQALQCLGELNDQAGAMAQLRAHASQAPAAQFALGWLAALHEQQLRQTVPVMKALVAAPLPWRD
ncbi:CHAD domain-containing protein [Paucibacter sp. KCTC 42545]|uniref:CHAD domain-containing protein n=1 Tax=Paucibacter sp. KCTC 42545 TaxID=1768242 RepID=UPI000733A14B|nr:CHAD domain-containing protein [Paucibacter sp. KCTC 42545]ALT76073.1 hypothetical protein AT984_01465 [Paucibacter sp. KCTC 42545]